MVVGTPAKSKFPGAGRGRLPGRESACTLGYSVLLGSFKDIEEGGSYSLCKLFYLWILFVLFCVEAKGGYFFCYSWVRDDSLT